MIQMEPRFIFDMDGTLTPSRSKMDPDFEKVFQKFCNSNYCCIVTGAGFDQVQKQLSRDTIMAVDGIFPCAGNEKWVQGELSYQRANWKPSERLIRHLNAIADASDCPYKNGNHIDIRTDMLNFSTMGQNPTPEQREQYILWDKLSNERELIRNGINSFFKEGIYTEFRLEAVIAGETGLDIYPKGRDKSQILDHFHGHELIFFGDSIQEGGNDHKIASFCDVVWDVKDWENTKQILELCYI